MFRRTVVLSVFLVCAYSTHATITLKVTFDNLSVTQTLKNGEFIGIPVYGESGAPQLPFFSYDFLVPSDAELNTVTATIQESQEEVLQGLYDIKPALPPSVNEEIQYPAGKTIINGKDVAIYNVNAFYPSNFVTAVTIGKLQEYKLVKVVVSPYQYNPVTRQLKKLVTGEIVLQYLKTRTPSTFPHGIPYWYMEQIKSYCVNFDQVISSYPAPKRQKKGYAIVTMASIKSGLKNLQSFIDSKKNRGFEVSVIDESQWGGGTGNSAAENLRKWLKANYQNMGIYYLLIIGNPTPTSGDIAMKIFKSKASSGTDYYFSELSGTADGNKNGTFGESADNKAGDPDCNHELALGRIPVYSSDLTAADAILAKFTLYENESQETAQWRFKMLAPMMPSDASTPGNHLANALKDKVCTPNQWGCYRICQNKDPGNVEKTPCTVANVVAAYNSDNYGMTVWWTHGNPTSASGIMDVTNATKLKSDHPTFTYQVSCTNASPATKNNLAYTLLTTKAVGTIAGTDLTYYMPGQTNFDNSSSNSGTSYNWAKVLINGKLPNGDAFNKMRATVPVSGMWVNWGVFVLYGDPSIGPFVWAGTTDITTAMNESVNPLATLQYRNSKLLYRIPSFQQSDALVTINLYNVRGILIKSLLNEMKNPGTYSLELRPMKTIATGMYLCTMCVGEYNETIKIAIK